MKIQLLINTIPDPTTRQAVQALFEQVVADAEANKAAFDGHSHGGTAATDTPEDADGAVTFTSTLTK